MSSPLRASPRQPSASLNTCLACIPTSSLHLLSVTPSGLSHCTGAFKCLHGWSPLGARVRATGLCTSKPA
eukprot:14281198-Alexandrium_andersonii.AAC.1